MHTCSIQAGSLYPRTSPPNTRGSLYPIYIGHHLPTPGGSLYTLGHHLPTATQGGSLYPRTSPPNNTYTGRELIPLPTQHQGAYFCVQLKGELMFLGRAPPLANSNIEGACTISGSLIPSGVRSLHVPLAKTIAIF